MPEGETGDNNEQSQAEGSSLVNKPIDLQTLERLRPKKQNTEEFLDQLREDGFVTGYEAKLTSEGVAHLAALEILQNIEQKGGNLAAIDVDKIAEKWGFTDGINLQSTLEGTTKAETVLAMSEPLGGGFD